MLTHKPLEPKLHLIIMGNRNVNTFANTLRAVIKQWGAKSIYAIHLIRPKSENETPDWRGLCNTLLGGAYEYHEYPITDATNLATTLPSMLSQILAKEKTNKSIIVDLTNGTKTWCNFVYLVCTLMQISNIFRVQVPKEEFMLPYNQVNLEAIQVQLEPIPNTSDLQRLIRSTYSEYIYYLQEVTTFIEWAKTDSLIQLDFAKLYERLLKAFEHYMRGDFDACIVSAATILEEILDETLRLLASRFGSLWMALINNNSPQNSLGSKAHTLGQACTRVNQLISGIQNGFTQSIEGRTLRTLKETFDFAPLISVGMHCQSLAMIRNYSGHGNRYSSALQNEVDARQMLHGVLYILGKIRACTLFRGN
ncbi:hypothetical protein [Chloroflexus islandicus]|uniref:hypothetical protein n=1 Tax=Chloroflexus islandicus TaxID=1707952 RepID=UPI000AAF3171|nr:hypothetical protein [Chloroflexus islandicus]